MGALGNGAASIPTPAGSRNPIYAPKPQRGSLTVWVTPEALEAWAPEKSGRRGRPTSYSDIVIETAVMLRLAMGKPWRQTEGMLRSIIGMLGLDLPVPDHTTPLCPAA